MNSRSILLAATMVCSLAAAGSSAAATFHVQTTPDQVANVTGLKGGSTLTFDALARGNHSSITSGGVTITSNGGAFDISEDYSGSYNTFGRSLTNNGYWFNQLNFDFTAPVSGFGFFFGASDVAWTLNAYDAAGNLLDALSISEIRGGNAGDFYGIFADGIARATLVGQTSDHVFLDNFTTGSASVSAVPEPATWAMLIAGFGLVGSAMRRSRWRGLALA